MKKYPALMCARQEYMALRMPALGRSARKGRMQAIMQGRVHRMGFAESDFPLLVPLSGTLLHYEIWKYC